MKNFKKEVPALRLRLNLQRHADAGMTEKKIAILGLGINNVGLASFFVKQKLAFTICDKDIEARNKFPKLAKSKLASWKLGKDYLKNLTDFDIVFRTPGLPYLTPEIQEAKKKGVEISSQTKLFFDLCPCKIIGVSGTKGKGTATTLIYNMLKASGKTAYLAGNIGKDPFEFLAKLKKSDWVCLELSSFQLQDLHKSPHIGVALMITQEHLDHHKTVEEYREAKKSLVKYQTQKDFAVINFDFPSSRNFAKEAKGQVYFFSRRGIVKRGAFVEDGKIILADDKGLDSRLAPPRAAGIAFGDARLKLRATRGRGNDRKKDGKDRFVICKITELKLKGQHNWENIAAAAAAAYLAGVKLPVIRKEALKFKGLEHRLELAGVKKGISYYNDSFATTPEAAIAAVKSFSEPIVLICGGSEKGSDYKELGEAIQKSSVKSVILIGQTAEQIKKTIGKTNINLIEGCKNMDEIFAAIKKAARKGDVVLLSPACASFGMFKNYKDRGEQFRNAVKQLT